MELNTILGVWPSWDEMSDACILSCLVVVIILWGEDIEKVIQSFSYRF